MTAVAEATKAPAVTQRRAWLIVWWGMFACSWAGNQFSPLLLMYEDKAHYSSVMANVFLGVYVLGLVPALLIAGSLSDRHGRKPLMLAGVTAALIGSALLAAGPLGVGFLLVGRVFSGFAVGTAMAVGTSWITELTRPPFLAAAPGTGARRSSLAFLVGSAVGALVAGLIAQWGPIPEVLPFLVHLAITVPIGVVLLRAPESKPPGHGVTGPWWRQLAIPSAGHRRFVRVVVVTSPWIFASAAIGYGYLPTQLRGATGHWGLVFATTATVLTLAVSSLAQPLAKRLHSTTSGRGLVVSLGLLTVGLGIVAVAIREQSVWIGLASSVVIGLGIGISLVSTLLEVQRIATASDLAGLTGLFYAAAYAGFLLPAGIAALAAAVPLAVILWSLVGLAAVSWVAVLAQSRRYLPV